MTALFDAVFAVFVLAIVVVAVLVLRSAFTRVRRQRQAQQDRLPVDDAGRGGHNAL